MIKPCPFCGNEVYIEKRPLWREYGGTKHGYVGNYEFDIHCEKCGCRVDLGGNSTLGHRSEEEAKQNAIAAWNKRAEEQNKKESVIHESL